MEAFPQSQQSYSKRIVNVCSLYTYSLTDPHCICHFTNRYKISSEFGSTDNNEFWNSKSSRILPKSAVVVVVAKVSRTHTCPSPASLTYLFHRDVGGDFARSLCSVSLFPPLLSYTLRPFFKCLMLSLIWWILSHWSKGKAISCTWHLTNMPGLISSELKSFSQHNLYFSVSLK